MYEEILLFYFLLGITFVLIILVALKKPKKQILEKKLKPKQDPYMGFRTLFSGGTNK